MPKLPTKNCAVCNAQCRPEAEPLFGEMLCDRDWAYAVQYNSKWHEVSTLYPVLDATELNELQTA